jgi:release factor glutamine methyltransferase
MSETSTKSKKELRREDEPPSSHSSSGPRPPGGADVVWTVGRVLSWTAERFRQAEMESGRLEAEILLASVLGCSRVGLYTDYHKPLDERERDAYRKLVRRRLRGEPTAYLVGEKEFWSLPFYVDERVLIPRPETELLVEIALEVLKDIEAPFLFEMGTGSGCVAVAIAKERPDARVVATDIDGDALDVARRNVERNEAGNVELRQGAGLEPVTEAEMGHVDLIVSNPPYVATSRLDQVQEHVIAYEPERALLAGKDGLDVIRMLVARAPRALKQGGWLVTEIDPAQAEEVEELLERAGSFDRIQVRHDLTHRDRAALARRKPRP